MSSSLRFIMGALAAFLIAGQGSAAEPARQDFRNHQDILGWIERYRFKPEPKRLPAAVHGMRAAGLFEDLDNAGLFIGFTAGILGKNPRDAEKLITKMFPMPPKEQGVIIKAIAHSGLPNWKQLLAKFAERMPGRTVLIDAYLHKGEKTLMDMPLEKGPFVLDTLWGYYYATGDYRPVGRIITALKWSREKGDLDKFTAASTARWTLAANAERNRELVVFYRSELAKRGKKIVPHLKEVIDASEAYEAARLRKQSLAAIEERKRQGPRPSWGFAAEVGSTSLSIGCVIASAAGQPHIAAPCVVAGALYSGAMHLWRKSWE